MAGAKKSLERSDREWRCTGEDQIHDDRKWTGFTGLNRIRNFYFHLLDPVNPADTILHGQALLLL
jgi:hypothetical protein